MTTESTEEGKAIIRVGPAGWSYKDWNGRVYPPGLSKRLHPLKYLAGFFDTLEVNASFYRPVDPRNAARWVDHIADNPRFMLTAKLWRRFTHDTNEWPGNAEARRFANGLTPLRDAGKLGALLVQFPYRFHRTTPNRDWLRRIAETFSAFPLAVEFRHDSWRTPETLEGFREYDIAFCNIDQPVINASLSPTEEVTAPLAYVRLHGRNYDNWFRETADRDARYNYLYTEEELKPWIPRIARMRERAAEIYVVTNNHFEGQAVVNALELMHGLGKPIEQLPETLLAAYPRLAALRPGTPPAAAQDSPDDQ